MTQEEYNQKLQQMVAEPDKAATIATELSNAIGEDKASAEDAANKSAEQEKRIQTLKEQNMQLFLTKIGNGNTATEQEQEEEEVTPETIAKKFLDEYKEFKKGK